MNTTTTPERTKALEQISKLNDESLKILAELSQKPGIEKKLKDNLVMLKAFL